MKSHFIIFLLLACINAVQAQRQLIDGRMYHVRSGQQREWNEFPAAGARSQLSISFNASSNHRPATIEIRQYDVKQEWLVLVNNQHIGNLTEDEKDLNIYLDVPAGLIRNGSNTIEIKPATKTATETDDIRVGRLTYHALPSKELLSECKISLLVRDKNSKAPLPSKITITNSRGTLQTAHIDTATGLAARPGTVYTANGKAVFGLPAGSYKIYATRGFEYGVDSISIVLQNGDRLEKEFIIEREVATEGWVSTDTHIHSLTHSGHGDATFEERAITIAGEGIEVPVITEHNKAVDIKATAERLALHRWFTPITGNEVTTARGHFNVFPVDTSAKLTDHKSPGWKSLSNDIRSAGIPVVILNHAEDIHNNFRPFDTSRHIAVAGLLLQDPIFPANAMEVMNAGSQQQDILKLYHDWFGMMNRGYWLTPVGSSDSHDVNRFTVGQSRTYIKAADTNTASISIDEVTRHFLEGRVMVSFGLLTRMVVNKIYEAGDLVPGNEKILVSIEVSGPKWMDADKITLFANGKKISQAVINTKGRQVRKWKGSWLLPAAAHDFYLVAIAEGPGKDLPFWKIAKPFQKTSPAWTPRVIGSTGAIWIDADRDGRRTSSYAYAKAVIDKSGPEISGIISKLAPYDEAVAIQAAAILWQTGYDLENATIKTAMKSAAPATIAGFRIFNDARKKSASHTSH
jgi:hypothetical protein